MLRFASRCGPRAVRPAFAGSSFRAQQVVNSASLARAELGPLGVGESIPQEHVESISQWLRDQKKVEECRTRCASTISRDAWPAEDYFSPSYQPQGDWNEELENFRSRYDSAMNTAIKSKGQRYELKVSPGQASTAARDASPWQRARARGLDRLRGELLEKGYAKVGPAEMRRWLDADLVPNWGTSAAAAFPRFRQLWDEAPPQVSEGSETIYEHKHVFHSLYDLRGVGEEPTRRHEGIAVHGDGVRRQRYVAHETTSTDGEATPYYVRHYPALPDKWDRDPMCRALRGVFAELCSGPSQGKLGIKPPYGLNLYQFCYRTIIEASRGDPGPEGIHVDGGTAAMIVTVRRDNLKPGTGGTRVWKMEQGTGKPSPEDLASGENILGEFRPEEALEALFFLDERVLHEALRGELLDASTSATRDMFILDCRRKDGVWKGPQPGKPQE